MRLLCDFMALDGSRGVSCGSCEHCSNTNWQHKRSYRREAGSWFTCEPQVMFSFRTTRINCNLREKEINLEGNFPESGIENFGLMLRGNFLRGKYCSFLHKGYRILAGKIG